MKCNKAEVISEYLNGHNESETPNGSLQFNFIEGKRVLFSYGTHFPLSISLHDDTIFINYDSYSMTTATQKGDLSRALGYKNFKDLVLNKRDNIKLLDTGELKKIVNSAITSYAEYIEVKL